MEFTEEQILLRALSRGDEKVFEFVYALFPESETFYIRFASG